MGELDSRFSLLVARFSLLVSRGSFLVAGFLNLSLKKKFHANLINDNRETIE